MFTIYVEKNGRPCTDAEVVLYGTGWLDGRFSMIHTGQGCYTTFIYTKPYGDIYINGKKYGCFQSGYTIVLR